MQQKYHIYWLFINTTTYILITLFKQYKLIQHKELNLHASKIGEETYAANLFLSKVRIIYINKKRNISGLTLRLQ